MFIDDLEIEWDVPKPPRPIHFNTKTNVWYKKLNDMKQYPGREARVLNGLTYDESSRARTTIKNSLYRNDPYEVWEVSGRKQDDGTYGIWVSYQHRMNETEYQEDLRERGKRSEMMKARIRKRKLIEQANVPRSALSAALRPPRVD